MGGDIAAHLEGDGTFPSTSCTLSFISSWVMPLDHWADLGLPVLASPALSCSVTVTPLGCDHSCLPLSPAPKSRDLSFSHTSSQCLAGALAGSSITSGGRTNRRRPTKKQDGPPVRSSSSRSEPQSVTMTRVSLSFLVRKTGVTGRHKLKGSE